MQTTATVCLTKLLVTLAICLTTVAAVDSVYRHYAEQRHHALMLTFMQGGLPAVEARCILETAQPEEIAPCVKASTPVKGREL